MSTSTTLRVVIVGAGFCGITAAIECKLRGLHPILVDAYPGPSSHGDLLDFVHNAGRVFDSWDGGRIGRQLFAAGVNAAKATEFFNSKDELLKLDQWPQGMAEGRFHKVFAGHRGQMHQIIFDYAVEIGVEMRLSKRVVQYLDSDKERGVITQDGDKVLGDVVLACDGPKSLAREQLLHLKESKVNSGYAVFRAFFKITEEMKKDPAIANYIRDDQDTVRCWVGPDMHGLIYVWNNGSDCAWVLTHPDESDIAESWSEKAKRSDVMYFLDKQNFPDVWRSFLNVTPEDRLIDYKLVWRDPIDTWLSPSKKCAVMGDAAHCHLPTSAQGACQAIEDATVAAMCLQKCGGDAALGLQVFERIRYNRSHVIHQASISTRDIYHKNDWSVEFVRKNTDSLIIPLLPWVTDYNLYEDVEQHYDQLAQDIKSGKKGTIQELSLPAGGSYDSMKIKEDGALAVEDKGFAASTQEHDAKTVGTTVAEIPAPA